MCTVLRASGGEATVRCFRGASCEARRGETRLGRRPGGRVRWRGDGSHAAVQFFLPGGSGFSEISREGM
ncbi:hypothetical protein E2C01_078779 [Portunus trituberculatus]|uniref:Uncharacterized protein n=1 Tax=Portunus trituberculatus TaxID=210409 RepID=A0A5B7IV13_PORTR|nr:hypothetical protein [Portunus trituberculatus]